MRDKGTDITDGVTEVKQMTPGMVVDTWGPGTWETGSQEYKVITGYTTAEQIQDQHLKV